MLQHLGFLSFLLLAAGLFYVYRRWNGNLSVTFSQTVAHERSSYLYYIALFGVTLPILYSFFAYWFVPQFQLPAAFTVIAGISMAAQFVCTFFPDKPGWTSTEHRILTGISGVLLLPLLVILLFVPAVSFGVKLLILACLALMIWLLVIALRNQNGHRYALLLQIGYYVLFFVPIFYQTYR
jgi:hypothetical protein